MNTLSNYYGNGYWWLRSPLSDYSHTARSVNYDGHVHYNIVDSISGVVPALRIRL